MTRAALGRALHFTLLAALAATIASWLHDGERVTGFFLRLLAGLLALLLPFALVTRLRAATERRVRAALRVADLAAIGVVLAVGLSELMLRAAGALWPSALLAPADARAAERIRAYRLEPGRMHLGQRVNAQGYPDGPFAVERAAGSRRIVALGDSFATGVVDASKNFLTRLDELLDARVPTEVMNFGIRSTAPRDYLHVWRTEAQRYQPDLVLVCFFLGNDVQGTRGASFLHADSVRLFAFLRRLAALRAELAHAARAGTEPDAAREEGELRVEDLPEFTPERFAAIERGRLEVCRREPSRHTRREWEETLALLGRMADVIGPRLRVVLIPDEFQVNDALFAEVAGAEAAAFDRDGPNRRLAGFFAGRGVPCLDLLPALRAAESGGATYRVRDTHWNERGNEAAAQAIARWLDGPGGDAAVVAPGPERAR